MKWFMFLIFAIVVAVYVDAGFNKCERFQKDVIIILDASQSISMQDFKLAKMSIIQMLFDMKVTGNPDHVAFIIFGDNAELKFNLDTYDNQMDIINNINAAKNLQDVTAIGKALNLTVVEVLPKLRKDTQKFLFLFTDGSNNIFPSPYIYAEKIKDAGVRLVTVGIGKSVNSDELQRIASPSLDVSVTDFSILYNSLKIVMDHLCPLPDPIPLHQCNVDRIEFVIVQDCSSSLTDEDYRIAKEFALSLYEPLNNGGDFNRFAYIQFSDTVKLEFNLDTYTNYSDMVDHIKNAKRFGSATAIGGGLMEVKKKVLLKKRFYSPMLVMLITDGENNMWPRPQIIADQLKAAGVSILCLGVGDGINIKELQSIATRGKYFTVGSSKEIPEWSTRKTVLSSLTCDLNRKS